MKKLTFALIAAMALLTGCGADTPEEIAAKAERKRLNNIEDVHLNCSFVWESIFKETMYDPGSLDFDYNNHKRFVYTDKKRKHLGTVEVPYRAKNAFGGLIRKTAECEYVLETGQIVNILR